MNLDKRWDVRVERAVSKTLRTFPRKDSNAVEAAIVGMADNPYAGDIQKLGGEENSWRHRIGSYRISFEVHSDLRLVFVFKVARRTSTTY